MGSKPSNNFQSNRPESGGANHDEQLEKSGLLEREKQEFAAAEKERQEKPVRGGAMEPGEKSGDGAGKQKR